MKLLDTFIYKGIKREVVGKPLYPCASVQFIEYVDYGIPLHKQQRVRIYLSELERDGKARVAAATENCNTASNMVDVDARKDSGTTHNVEVMTSTANIIYWPFGEAKGAV